MASDTFGLTSFIADELLYLVVQTVGSHQRRVRCTEDQVDTVGHHRHQSLRNDCRQTDFINLLNNGFGRPCNSSFLIFRTSPAVDCPLCNTDKCKRKILWNLEKKVSDLEHPLYKFVRDF